MFQDAGTGRIRGVLFDLGDTLLNYGRLSPHKPFMQASRQTYEYLKGLGQPVGCFAWYAVRSLVAIRRRLLWSAITGRDFDSLHVLRRAGERSGYKMTAKQYEELVWLWYEPLSRHIETEPDLHQTLAKLRARGLKMGIVSNTFVSACALNRDIAERKLADFFELVYYSYDFAQRKPHSQMYLAAAQALGFAPGQIVFVGDRLDTDVKGAMRAGMHAVLKKSHANLRKKAPLGVLRINAVAELPQAIDVIEKTLQAGTR
ncbi:MAG TPA: HAD family hydrolase [Sedimentisphaerales bacterium]|nr:HAD family hydrolase [Sedimentisphaerales bacterium]